MSDFATKLLVLFSLFATLEINAQDFQWTHTAGEDKLDMGTRICSDTKGNSYVTGYFNSDKLYFGDSIIENRAYEEVFIVKFDPEGKVIWADNPKGIGRDFGYGITADENGNCYITGSFSGKSIQFDNIILKNNLDYDGENFFVAKYDAQGKAEWAINPGGTKGSGICNNQNGTIYVTGHFRDSIFIMGKDTLKSYGMNNFIAAMNTKGEFLWARTEGGTAYDTETKDISSDLQGNVYVTGSFQTGSMVFDGITINNPTNSYDVFVVKFDAVGKAIWAARAGGASTDSGTGISNDEHGNTYVTGYFMGQSFSVGEIKLKSGGSYDVFVAKYDSTGKNLWAIKAGAADYDQGNAISTDAEGNSYVTGAFGGTYPLGTFTLSSKGGSDIFVFKIDTNGKIVQINTIGGSEFDMGKGIAHDPSGNIFVTGTFVSSSIQFGNIEITMAGGYDIFVTKILN